MSWQFVNDLPALDEQQVHVWQINTDKPPLDTIFLTVEEQQRANKLHFKQHRQRFTHARSFLRYLLGHYLHHDPLTIPIKTSALGKPYVDETFALPFNLAHSGNIAVYAFNKQSTIGIDVESNKTLRDIYAIAERVFSPIEIEYLRLNTNEKEARHCFFTLWSRKEAIIKATGEGLSAPLQTITTTLADGSFNQKRDYAPELQMSDLPAITDFCGALACARNKKIGYFSLC